MKTENLGPVLFNTLIKDIDDGVGRTLSKSADNTQLSGAVDPFEVRETIQRNLDRLEKWAYWNLRRCSVAWAIPDIYTD